MSNITVTHAGSGLLTTQVLRSQLITPPMTRATFSGGRLDQFTPLGFDQWFRLGIPVSERGVPKGNVTFCGDWKRGKSAPS